jgi:hypothetical protein
MCYTFNADFLYGQKPCYLTLQAKLAGWFLKWSKVGILKCGFWQKLNI